MLLRSGRETYAESLHQHSIAQADVRIREHVLALIGLVRSLAAGLVVDADDHEPLVRDRVDEVLAADFDGVHGIGDGAEERGEQRERAEWLSLFSCRSRGRYRQGAVVMPAKQASPQHAHAHTEIIMSQKTNDRLQNRGTNRADCGSYIDYRTVPVSRLALI
jgi:hypothetical protein